MKIFTMFVDCKKKKDWWIDLRQDHKKIASIKFDMQKIPVFFDYLNFDNDLDYRIDQISVMDGAKFNVKGKRKKNSRCVIEPENWYNLNIVIRKTVPIKFAQR